MLHSQQHYFETLDSKVFCSGGVRSAKLFGRLDLDQGGVIVSVFVP